MAKTNKPDAGKSNDDPKTKARRGSDSKTAQLKPGIAEMKTKQLQVNALAAAMPFNATKPSEYGFVNALVPPQGDHAQAASAVTTASTLSQSNTSAKTGTQARSGHNAAIDSLDRVRVDSSERHLTTNQGVKISDNQNSLKLGLRGPALLEDFVLREKLTHFDHERIPERIVHARGSGAHGY
ncbi:MAG TPA: catalase, partial [Burkholderiaceae bacterium]|nr:catalase [Burkholderiaceae bacterium]